jgi:hypothetical protein
MALYGTWDFIRKLTVLRLLLFNYRAMGNCRHRFLPISQGDVAYGAHPVFAGNNMLQ